MLPQRHGHKDLDFGDFGDRGFGRDGRGDGDLFSKDGSSEAAKLPPFAAKSPEEERIPFYEVDFVQMQKAIDPGVESKSKKAAKK